MRTDTPAPWENCLYKHYVRLAGWLPLCTKRLAVVKNKYKGKSQRRLRYFTFCGTAARDVLLLDLEKIVIPNNRNGDFDNVTFFDLDELSVAQTRKLLQNAVGFPAKFEKVMLAQIPSTGALQIENDYDEEVRDDREQLRLIQARRDFFKRFPFDIINLDLCGHVLKPSDPFPGEILNAMRQMFEWQREPLIHNGKSLGALEGFTLMFTTEIGPKNLSDEHINQLEGCLNENLQKFEDLGALLKRRAGTDGVKILREEHFDLFFEIAIPKLIAKLLLDEDWVIDKDPGIVAFKFARPETQDKAAYSMLHFAMQVSRQSPSRTERIGGVAPSANEAYKVIVQNLFANEPQGVDEILIIEQGFQLSQSLDRVRSRAAKYIAD